VKFRQTCIFSLKLFTFNMTVGFLLPAYYAAYHDGIIHDFAVETFPSTGKFIAQVAFCIVMDDFVLFCLPGLFHHPLLYTAIHKLHHQFYCTVSFAAFISHPLEHIFVNTLAYSSGPLLLGKSCHFFTVLMWNLWKIYECAVSHCGYDFPWMPFGKLPFSGGSDWHDYHHSHNKGIYGDVFFIWDKLMGTDVDYQKHKQAKLAKLRAK
jgi:sterol desaturase/sphingolipid hydroxylase (fatty acid hydroxylase superfamily)